MARATVARLGLGLLLLALSRHIYCNQTSVAPFSTNAAPNPNNATNCNALQPTVGLLALSLSLLHLYC
ncbi:signal transducer CD24-like [Acomys russatus]|uniref:signal transducer CD24-like n=1 Tax=Acomys russatus TaxID=60746 RepID=UPI0021E20E7B|nr:signal transducer CD24-like [Acomys russatus]